MYRSLRVVAVCASWLGGASALAPAQAGPGQAPAGPAPPGPAAQEPPGAARVPGLPPTICGQPFPQPAALPPDGSGPVIFGIAPCFEAQGNQTLVEPATYLYYIQLKGSIPSQGMWVPYDEQAEKTIRE